MFNGIWGGGVIAIFIAIGGNKSRLLLGGRLIDNAIVDAHLAYL